MMTMRRRRRRRRRRRKRAALDFIGKWSKPPRGQRKPDALIKPEEDPPSGTASREPLCFALGGTIPSPPE
eukprot:1970263-Pyramimonas_sp.AAC.1